MTSSQQKRIAAAGCDVRFNNLTRELYAADASIYQIEPAGVAFPRNAQCAPYSAQFVDPRFQKLVAPSAPKSADK